MHILEVFKIFKRFMTLIQDKYCYLEREHPDQKTA